MEPNTGSHREEEVSPAPALHVLTSTLLLVGDKLELEREPRFQYAGDLNLAFVTNANTQWRLKSFYAMKRKNLDGQGSGFRTTT